MDGLSCMNNQDACFETSWFDSEFTAHGIPCQNITATNIRSYNDVEAILINACNNVRVAGFSSSGSAKESVFVGQDPTTTTAHWPDRIAISQTARSTAPGTARNPLNTAARPGALHQCRHGSRHGVHLAYRDLEHRRHTHFRLGPADGRVTERRSTAIECQFL